MLTRFPIRNFKLFDDVELEPGERVVPIGPNNARKTAARLNSFEARKRADNLQARLQKRPDELKLEAQISPLPPVVLGGVLVVPPGLLNELNGAASVPATSAVDTQASAAHAREIIMEVERQLGFEPTDRKHEKLGYDIESRIPGTGRLRFIEVKGRIAGAQTITVTKDEILYSLNKPDDFILTIVEFLDGDTHRVHYLRRPSSASPISASPASTTISANSYRGQQSRHDV